MRRALRFFFRGVIIVVVLAVVLLSYYVYSPAPEIPRLSGKLTRGTIAVGLLKRTYLTYVPDRLPKGAPLLVVMHGSGETGAHLRKWTGYGFERLADKRGFALAYPDGYEGYWNACNVVGDYSANRLNIDDVGFLTALAGKLVREIGVDPARVFATGISRGGHMAFRLALEAPSRFRAVAAVSASVPVPGNFKCRSAGPGTSSTLIMNGTKDPINPFDGGEVKLFGLLARGKVRSSRESGQYFADLNNLSGTPATSQTQMSDGIQIEQVRWHGDSKVEVELVAIHGGGHGIPQPYWRYPRFLGPTAMELNGPEVIWAFFERQQPK